MSTDLKIALLCNNKMAMPAMQRLASEKLLCAVATADKDPEVIAAFSQQAQQFRVPYRQIQKHGHVQQLAEWLGETKADVVFVMTFPWKLPASLLNIPRSGFLNFHYGLLPEMRGADPIFESIRQRKPAAGATVHVMDDGLDTGPVLLREEIPLPPEYTYGMLCSQMAWLGDKLCTDMIAQLKTGKPLDPTPQDEAKAKYWPKIDENEMTIRWQEMDSAEVIALVRACNPIAKGVPTTINGWKIGVSDVSLVNLEGDAGGIAPGTIVVMDAQNGLIVYCKDGKGVKLEVVYTAEGVFPGYKLAVFGLANGMVFSN